MPACRTVQIKSSHPQSQGPFVEINESDFDAVKHERYIAPPPPPPAPPAAPPPPPPPPGPLANLARDWRNGATKELTAMAASVSGRTAEDRKQAIEMIEAALAGK